MNASKVQELIAKDLQDIIEWAQGELKYVENGMPHHSDSEEDITFYYQYIRNVKVSY
jgi:hypothetical protein